MAIFGLFVAGKGAAATWPKTQLMFAGPERPFERIRKWVKDKTVEKVLKEYRIGNYSRHIYAFRVIARQLKADWEWKHLLQVPGISFKTAKLVQIYTWPGTDRGACIDRHVLRWLKGPSVLPKAWRPLIPNDSPQQGPVYAMLEGFMCRYADCLNIRDWELDKLLWQAGQARMDPKKYLHNWRMSDEGQSRVKSVDYPYRGDPDIEVLEESQPNESRVLR